MAESRSESDVESSELIEDAEQVGDEEGTYTEEELRAGEGVIGLEAGSDKGAAQSGQNFGKTRAIID
ncbi:hypothetical protein ACFY0N_31955 [Streptomyces vinaceus]|uniref:hypothetical protein n=1 Tax=Streptomyces vinaceus TaxID=1960 RepID=UPI0035E08F92